MEAKQPGRILVAIFVFIGVFMIVDFRSFHQSTGLFETDLQSKVQTPPSRTAAEAWVSPMNRKRKMAYVDISMAAGTTVRETLQKSHSSPTPLTEALWADRSMKQVEDQSINAFVLEASNPIRRAIYAYSLLHPENSKQPADSVKRTQFYVDCYPSLTKLFEGTRQMFQQMAINGTLTDCQKLAVHVLRGDEESETVNPLLFYNTEYYLTNSIHKHPLLEVFVVRTEVVWEDLARLNQYLGGTTAGLDDKQEEGIALQVATSDKDQDRQLCCILWQNLDQYQRLLDRAQNLSPEDKEGTVIDLIDTCSVINDDTAESAPKILRDGYGVNWPVWYKLKCPPVEEFL